MMDMLAVTLLAIQFVLVIWIINLLCRSTEKQTRHSSANLNKIRPDVACTKQHALPRPVINDGFSTASGEDLNNQSCLRLKAKVDENNLIVLEKERLANELSLVQSQLADSDSKLRQFQNVHDELETTKCELEEKKREMTEIIGENLRLTNDDSRLRRTIEDRDRIIIEVRDKIMASSAIEKNQIVSENQRLANELSLVQSQLTDSHSKLRQFHNKLATTKSKLEEKKSFITDITEKNLRLTNENSRLKRKSEDRDRMIEDSDRIMASSRAIEKNLVMDKERLANELTLLQTQLRSSSSPQMFQTVHIELSITKNELENNKRLMTDITEKNLHLKKDDSRLRRKIEDRDKIIASSAIEKNLIILDKERLANELSLVQSQLTDSHSNQQIFQKVHDELATTKRELKNKKRQMTDIESKLESKNITISELETEILRWTENDLQLRQKLEETDRLLQSGQAEMEELRVSQTERIERLQDQVKSL
ncbi:hypothetical protein DAPPUDRAFT_332197 [Daphnia pulex]|uniref:Uncharacterized protein n=1 Tax=Daphnia pulex TaxID=6669 RepID=E9HP93_DAPPU|nr:hypothetical protein DAPPUDRAFT_332197 [Daphnia pulex]|eukprot:EFX66398.1 hypothetical protein DAPPUDRAFT_332197 [Daphnia pulex]